MDIYIVNIYEYHPLKFEPFGKAEAEAEEVEWRQKK